MAEFSILQNSKTRNLIVVKMRFATLRVVLAKRNIKRILLKKTLQTLEN
jgi:hypothetical protein